MKTEDILSHVDHTLLKAAASWEEIRKLCDEAVKYHTASVCVPSSYVKKIRENYPRLTICTVVGFPLGNGNSESKAEETIHALDDGADEIDMVINIGAVKNKNYDLVTEEIAVLKEIAGDKILKVIVETCYLTEEEKIRLCECVTKGFFGLHIQRGTGFVRTLVLAAKLQRAGVRRRHGVAVILEVAGLERFDRCEIALGRTQRRGGVDGAGEHRQAQQRGDQ